MDHSCFHLSAESCCSAPKAFSSAQVPARPSGVHEGVIIKKTLLLVFKTSPQRSVHSSEEQSGNVYRHCCKYKKVGMIAAEGGVRGIWEVWEAYGTFDRMDAKY